MTYEVLTFLSWYNEYPSTIYNFFIPYNEICRSYLFNIKEFWECIRPHHPYCCQEVECSPRSEEVPGLASPVSSSSSYFERTACTLFLSRWVSLLFPEHLINRTLGCVLVHGWFLSPRTMHLKLVHIFVTCSLIHYFPDELLAPCTTEVSYFHLLERRHQGKISANRWQKWEQIMTKVKSDIGLLSPQWARSASLICTAPFPLNISNTSI